MNDAYASLPQGRLTGESTASEEQLQLLIDNMADMVGILDPRGNYQFITPSSRRILGYEPDQLVGRNYFELVHPDDHAATMGVFQNIIAQNSRAGEEFRYRHADGHYIWLENVGTPLFDQRGELRGIVFNSRDITKRKHAEEQVKFLLYHDHLTSLYNRSYFEKELPKLNRPENLPLAIVMGDANGLKLTNDTFGHHEGDALLRKIAGVIKRAIRPVDIAVRWGGDEFLIVLPRADDQVVADVVREIQRLCIKVDDSPIKPSVSLGHAIRWNSSQHISRVLKKAEEMMYANKWRDQNNSRQTIISCLEKSLLKTEEETFEHMSRMKELALSFGRKLGLSKRTLDELVALASLHDIGKLALPPEIIGKAGQLTTEEWEHVKKHPELGYHLALSSPELSFVAEGILAHHEWWDGSGYPRGLVGEEIPLSSRVISIVDAYDVMTNRRPYKEAVSHEEAARRLLQAAGKQFDPKLVAVFLNEVVGQFT